MAQNIFVLVHGAWSGGWCWRRVADRLQAKGHRVFAPTLTGLADRSHLIGPGVNLSTHVTDVANLIRWEELEDVVLVGHSYGGMVVTGVADQLSDRIASLVYLDAFVPESGQSLQDLRSREFPPGLALPPPPADQFQVNVADRAMADRLSTPHPAATMTERLQLSGAYRTVRRKSYIRAADYPSPVFEPTYERFKNDPAWTVHRIRSGHEVMLDAPDALAELLERMA